MDVDAAILAVDALQPPKMASRRAGLDRLLIHIRLALARGVTVDMVVDTLLENGIRMSPDQLRAYLGGGRPPRRPPAAAALIVAPGPVSSLMPPGKRRGRPRKGAGCSADMPGEC